jgi:glycosyltransferase involved in cell wall biosynthesis
VRIAQVAPLIESVPPVRYGGTERVVSYLTEALVAQGHDVTLFASGDSVTTADLVSVIDRALRLHPRRVDAQVWHTLQLEEVFDRAASFDIIHFHVDVAHFPLASRCKTPHLTTLHGRLDLPDLAPLYARFPNAPLVSISDAQRVPLPDANWAGTVHHGLPLDLYQFHPEPQDYFAFVGRISPEKRVDRAIEIAIACNTRLRIGAKVDPADQVYFEQHIRPLLGHPLVEYEGEIDDRQKNDFIGNARALLFPIDWPEPFGLVAIEAMACGVPVVAYRHGAVPEIVSHGQTGYVVSNQQQAIDAARRVDRIDRRRCRRHFERRFSSAAMAATYVELYRRLVETATAPAPFCAESPLRAQPASTQEEEPA